MLQKDGPRLHASAQQTQHWLVWLAHQLTAHHQTELYLEYLQPDWLPEKRRSLYRWSIRLAVGLLFGLLFGLVGGLLFGLLFGLVVGLVGGPLSALHTTELMLPVYLVLSQAFSYQVGGLVRGLCFALFVGLRFGRRFRPRRATSR